MVTRYGRHCCKRQYLWGGSYVPKAAYGVVDYNNTGQTVTIGYAGNGFSASDFTYALGLNTSRQIKDVSKSEYQKWLGLGSLAYKSSLSYSDVGAAASSHTHTSLIDVDESSRQISISYAGDAATSINHLCCFVNGGTKIKDANETAVKTLLGLNNVNNTADANKSVNYATSSGLSSKANILKYTHTNEVNFSGGMQNTCYFNYRNADTDTCDGGTTGITYKFCNYNNNVANTVLDAASFTGTAAYAKIVKDSGNSTNTTFAYSKAGMDYSAYTWLAAWNGYELRGVNKSQFATSGHTHSGMITTSNISSYNAGGTDFYVATKSNVSLSSSSNPTALCSITLPAGYYYLITATIDYINAGSNGCCLSIYEKNATGYSVDTLLQAYSGYCTITTSYIGKVTSQDTLTLYGRIGGSGGGKVKRATIQAVRVWKY